MKKIIKIMMVIVVIFIILVLGGIGFLYIKYPPSELKLMAQNYVKENFNREISYDSLGLSFSGVNIKNFKVSEVSTFEQGVFFEAKTAKVKLQIKPLLQGNIIIDAINLDGLELNIIKNADGKFNFDDLIKGNNKTNTEEKSEKVKSAYPHISIADFSVNNSNFIYKDESSKSNYTLQNVNLSVKDFTLEKTFPFVASLQTSITLPNMALNPVDISIKGTANLENITLSKAFVNVDELSVAYRKAKLAFKGTANNFEAPIITLEGTISGIDDEVIKSIKTLDLPKFALPVAKVIVKANADLKNQTAKVAQADILLDNSYLKTNLDVNYGKNLSLTGATNINLSLTEIYHSAKEMLKEIAPTGSVNGNLVFTYTDKPTMSGKIDIKNVGAVLLDKELRNVNGEITIKSLDSIKTNTITGVYNSSNFKTSIAYTKPAKEMNLDFMFNLDKFTLDDINFDELLLAKNKEVKQEEKTKEKKENTNFDAVINLKTDIFVKEVSNNVLTTKDLTLKTDLKKLSSDMKTLSGQILFSSTNGEIRDIEKLMGSSKIFKVIFSSVNIIQKVFSIAKLENLSLDKGGKITYSSIEGDYNVNQGKVAINKTDLTSDLLNVKTDGTVDLISENLDMKVNAHFGKVTSSGFKPVVIKVNGTMSKPTYKVDVLSTLTSILGGSKSKSANNDNAKKEKAPSATDAVKSIASSIGSLFKKN